MEDEIQIVVNGLRESAPQNATIHRLIRIFREDDAHLIVEHNGSFVYPQNYDKTVVKEGDILEFINPDFGG